jgi:hypothetical protein
LISSGLTENVADGPLSLGAAEKSGRPARRAEIVISVGDTPR